MTIRVIVSRIQVSFFFNRTTIFLFFLVLRSFSRRSIFNFSFKSTRIKMSRGVGKIDDDKKKKGKKGKTYSTTLTPGLTSSKISVQIVIM